MYNIIQMIQNGQNPQQIVMSILQKQQSPMAANLAPNPYTGAYGAYGGAVYGACGVNYGVTSCGC